MRKRYSGVLAVCSLLFFPILLKASPNNLKGGVRSQKRQNRIADKHRLTRLKERRQLERFIEKGLLIEIKDTSAYFVSEFTGTLDADHQELYRYARPWVKRFVDDVLGEGHQKFDEEFKITSLVRTRWYQKKLSRVNRNAIRGQAWWQTSSHLTGSTVDVSYKDMSPEVRKWFEKKLSQMEKQGLVEATKERRSRHYHIMVHPQYEKKLERLKARKRKRRKHKTRR